MLSRKQARENAFLLIFEKCFNDLPLEELLETAKNVRDFEADEYTKAVFSGVYDNLEEIDSVIKEKAVGWKIERLSRVVLSLLRLSVYEITKMDDIPANVSVSEAVVLCKKYATEEDASYLNGILGAVVKDYTEAK